MLVKERKINNVKLQMKNVKRKIDSFKTRVVVYKGPN